MFKKISVREEPTFDAIISR